MRANQLTRQCWMGIERVVDDSGAFEIGRVAVERDARRADRHQPLARAGTHLAHCPPASAWARKSPPGCWQLPPPDPEGADSNPCRATLEGVLRSGGGPPVLLGREAKQRQVQQESQQAPARRPPGAVARQCDCRIWGMVQPRPPCAKAPSARTGSVRRQTGSRWISCKVRSQDTIIPSEHHFDMRFRGGFIRKSILRFVKLSVFIRNHNYNNESSSTS